MPKINCLYEKYLNSPIPKKYNCKEIQELFIAKYDAKIMDIKEMTLFLDPLEVDSFCACLMIDNCDILNRIFTKEEKQGFKDIQQYNQQYSFDVLASRGENEYTRIQEGEYVLVFLSVNFAGAVENFKLVGNSSRIFDELLVRIGVDNNECHLDNRTFCDYLLALSNLGYLK